MEQSSAAWVKQLDIHVLDPDGWDRRHFDASWNEPISRKEFDARLSVSTITDIEVSEEFVRA